METQYEYGGAWEGPAMWLLVGLPIAATVVAAVGFDPTDEQLAQVFVGSLIAGLVLLPFAGWWKGLLGSRDGPLDDRVAAVQQALMWFRNDRALVRDVRREEDGAISIGIGHRRLSRALEGRSGRADEAAPSGDPALDEAWRCEPGSAGAVLAALDADGRRSFGALVRSAARAELVDGMLRMTWADEGGGDGADDPLLDRAKEVIAVVDALVAAGEEVPRRLVQRYETEAAPAVREAAVAALLGEFGTSDEAAALGPALVAGDDPRFGLVAARALHRPDAAARFEAMLEGRRGRLAVSAEAGDAGGLAIADRAGPGALSEEPS